MQPGASSSAHPPSSASSLYPSVSQLDSAMPDDAGPRSSQGSGRSTHSRRAQNPQQQLSQIEKSVTHLLVATKQLLETLTLWSRGTSTESEVSDVYVRLGYEFNIASRAFNTIGVDTSDLGNVPELLRGILEETLSQEASQASLDNYLPRIRDIIINLLQGLKKKQQWLRQRNSQNGSSPRQGSVASTGDLDISQARSSSTRTASRLDSNDAATDGPDLPPRSSSVPERASPNRYDTLPANPRVNRGAAASQHSANSSLSSNALQNMPVISPYPAEDTMPRSPEQTPSPYVDFPPPPPPPPPPKQQDALAALQRGGELERRASRRFSAYQISKHLGGTNGVPMIPSQHSPVPNRGRDARESMNAVRMRGSALHSRQRSNQRPTLDTYASRANEITTRRISEESSQSSAGVAGQPAREPAADDSPLPKTPEDKVSANRDFVADRPTGGPTLSGPLAEPSELPVDTGKRAGPSHSGAPRGARKTKSPSPHADHFVPEQSPQPGKELTLFLQYKSKIKKFVLADGFNELSLARLQLAFIEKFAWNTHSNGMDLPEIYLQDPVSGVRHELEDLAEIKDRSVLVLNVEVLDEVKRHFDDGVGGLRRIVEGIKHAVDDQQSAIQRVSDRQQDTAKEIAGLAAAPPVSSARVSTALVPRSPLPTPAGADTSATAATQLSEVQSLQRDLAVVRQTFSSFMSDVEGNMSAIRTKASAVKSAAVTASLPDISGDSGRSYVNAGKKTLQDDSEKIVSRVDEVQDVVEDLRKDVVLRGVRPLPRQLETTAKDLSVATAELKKLQDFLAREKPLWTKIWEQELQMVCEERDLLTMQEDLATDLQDDLEKAAQTLELVEQATKQQNQQSGSGSQGTRSASGRNLVHAAALDKAVNPQNAIDGVLGEVRALQPNHEGRLEAIERAEKARQRELEGRRDGEFKMELGSFVEEGKLKKSGGVEEAERMRKSKDERMRKEVWERQNGKAAAEGTNGAAETEPVESPTKDVANPTPNGVQANGQAMQSAAAEGGDSPA